MRTLLRLAFSGICCILLGVALVWEALSFFWFGLSCIWDAVVRPEELGSKEPIEGVENAEFLRAVAILMAVAVAIVILQFLGHSF